MPFRIHTQTNFCRHCNERKGCYGASWQTRRGRKMFICAECTDALKLPRDKRRRSTYVPPEQKV